MKGYYKIDTMKVMEGTLELWESEKYGDEAPAKVTLNGQEVGETEDDLRTFYHEDFEA